MRIIADLHVHSKYARATSARCDIDGLAKGAKIKGINVVATGDFTHPAYFQEVKKFLGSDDEQDKHKGLFLYEGTYFILSTEVALFYELNGKQLRMHHVILTPGLEEAEQLNDALARFGDLKADGRPMLGLSSAALVEECEKISKDFFIIPAHAWTPWYGIFGSKTGVDSVEEAFEDKANRVLALETGLSSDPAMNWMVSRLDRYSLVSNSDAHSPEKLGREANVFEIDNVDYRSIINAIATRKDFVKTYEFYPEEGKYHYDGHRKCGIRWSPWESIKHKNICPVCRKPVTVGVLHRVVGLADRKPGEKPAGAVPFQHIVPLTLLISKVFGKPEYSGAVMEEYDRLIRYFGNEFAVFEAEEALIYQAVSPEVAKAVLKVRHEEVKWLPGYDGVFGEIILNDKAVKGAEEKKQKKIFDF